MALQTRDLVMVALGVVDGQTPPTTEQPTLAGGIHLRWAFERSRGFPWYGYYLFRREPRPTICSCLSTVTRELQNGLWPRKSMATHFGRLSSDANLVLTRAFSSSPSVEFDLDGEQNYKSYLRFDFPEGQPVRLITATIGFRPAAGEIVPEKKCVSFGNHIDGAGPNPRSEAVAGFAQPLVFTAKNFAGNLAPTTQVVSSDFDGEVQSALGCDSVLEITFPCASTVVDLAISQTFTSATITAFNQDGSPPVTVFPQFLPQGRVPVRLTGTAINKILIQTSGGETRLHDICFACAPSIGGAASDINVTLLSTNVPVSRSTVTGRPGETRTVSFEFDFITAIQFSAGPAVLIDICFVPVAQDATRGWVSLGAPVSPMCLPVAVAQSDYPCKNAPKDGRPETARDMALGRVKYGSKSAWPDDSMTQMHEALKSLVVGGPGSEPMTARDELDVPAELDSGDPFAENPKMKAESPLDTVLLAALNPAFAQMVGLYWVDETAEDNKAYDYLIVADYEGSFIPPHATVGDHEIQDFDSVDGYIVFNVKKENAPALSAPTNVRSYSLPGTGLFSGSSDPKDTGNSAGLLWDLELTEGGLLPRAPFMYHVWRANLATEPASPPDNYSLITADNPVVVSNDEEALIVSFIDPKFDFSALTEFAPERSRDWPPFRLYFMDASLADGWYSYQVCSVDIFGRYSPRSLPARWFQWQPEPKPRPWYYQLPAGDKPIHNFALHLLDKNPPPPPTAIEAYALDPADPTVVKDGPYKKWRKALEKATWYQALTEDEKTNLIGLRIRWQWTEAHRRQAPDTKEFRIYYYPGQMNALIGSSLNVSPAGGADSSIKSIITTDIANSQPANSYKGLWIQVGDDAFPIDSSEAASPLRLTVMNIGVNKSVRPQANQSCSIAISQANALFESGQPLFKDYSESANWAERLHRVDYDANLFTPEKDAAGNEMTGNAAAIVGFLSDLSTVISLDGTIDLSDVKHTVEDGGTLYLYLSNDTASPDKLYRIIRVDDLDKFVGVSGIANLSSKPSSWTIGQRVHKYEVFLPDPAGPVHKGLPLVTTVADPIKYAHIGVSAADDKAHTNDNVKWASSPWGSRPGNEGRVGARAKIFRVRRELPPEPESVDDRDKALATRADYYSRSFYTFRWKALDNLKTHIYRALDESVFKTDWLIRTTRSALNAELPQHDAFFPKHDPLPDGPPWPPSPRQTAADELNAISLPTSYDGLSADARNVLARLPGNEGFLWRDASAGATSGLSLQDRDWLIRSSRFALSADDTQFFPANWDRAKRADAATQIRSMTSILHGTAASLSDKTNKKVSLDGTQDLSTVVPYRGTLWLRGNSPVVTMRRYEITNVDVATRMLTLDEVPDVTAAPSAWAIFLDEYRDLTDPALRVLAGLPGNETAFVQITTQPLDPNDPTNLDRRGPDDIGVRENYVPDPALRAYEDTLDGRSTNRYLYRGAHIDVAYNRSFLSPSTPAVYLPDIIPPRAPIVTKVLSGNKQITLTWSSNREADLKEYRVYRADSKEKTRDLRLMEWKAPALAETRRPGDRSAEVLWTDQPIQGLVIFHYRVAAVDEAGNVSEASDAVAASAYDQTPPEPPMWISAAWNVRGDAIDLSWSLPSSDLQTIVLRRRPDAWQSVSQWLPAGEDVFRDSGADSTVENRYRLRVRNRAGNVNIAYLEMSVAPL